MPRKQTNKGNEAQPVDTQETPEVSPEQTQEAPQRKITELPHGATIEDF